MTTASITLKLPDDLVRRARILAAEQGTSVSALVADLLRQVTDVGADYDALWAAEERLMAEGSRLEVGEVTWSRTELLER